MFSPRLKRPGPSTSRAPSTADQGLPSVSQYDIQMIHMPQQTTVRFTDEDIALLDAIQERTGIVSRAEILRRAIRVMAEQEGVQVKVPRQRRKRNG